MAEANVTTGGFEVAMRTGSEDPHTFMQREKDILERKIEYFDSQIEQANKYLQITCKNDEPGLMINQKMRLMTLHRFRQDALVQLRKLMEAECKMLSPSPPQPALNVQMDELMDIEDHLQEMPQIMCSASPHGVASQELLYGLTSLEEMRYSSYIRRNTNTLPVVPQISLLHDQLSHSLWVVSPSHADQVCPVKLSGKVSIPHLVCRPKPPRYNAASVSCADFDELAHMMASLSLNW